MRTGFMALIGFAVLVCLMVMKQNQPIAEQGLVIGNIQQPLGGDTGCWFRFLNTKANTSDDGPVVLLEDSPDPINLEGLININHQDLQFKHIFRGENENTYYNDSKRIYLKIHYDSIIKDKWNCIDFPHATITAIQNRKETSVAVKGQCGCDAGLDPD